MHTRLNKSADPATRAVANRQATPAVQRQQGVEEEDLLQGKFDQPVQKTAMPEEEEILQGKLKRPLQRKPNRTGLPDSLKTGIENLSGMGMDDVKVHYNSAKPAQLHAHAYAQGTDIHVAPGQERHLAHEAWHVVQQKQGRVKPTMQLKGNVPVNDDAGLEQEADVMGAEALASREAARQDLVTKGRSANVVQGVLKIGEKELGEGDFKSLRNEYKEVVASFTTKRNDHGSDYPINYKKEKKKYKKQLEFLSTLAKEPDTHVFSSWGLARIYAVQYESPGFLKKLTTFAFGKRHEGKPSTVLYTGKMGELDLSPVPFLKETEPPSPQPLIDESSDPDVNRDHRHGFTRSSSSDSMIPEDSDREQNISPEEQQVVLLEELNSIQREFNDTEGRYDSSKLVNEDIANLDGMRIENYIGRLKTIGGEFSEYLQWQGLEIIDKIERIEKEKPKNEDILVKYEWLRVLSNILNDKGPSDDLIKKLKEKKEQLEKAKEQAEKAAEKAKIRKIIPDVGKPAMPDMPDMPDVVPDMPDVVPDMPDMPDVVPDMPDVVPDMPNVGIPNELKGKLAILQEWGGKLSAIIKEFGEEAIKAIIAFFEKLKPLAEELLRSMGDLVKGFPILNHIIPFVSSIIDLIKQGISLKQDYALYVRYSNPANDAGIDAKSMETVKNNLIQMVKGHLFKTGVSIMSFIGEILNYTGVGAVAGGVLSGASAAARTAANYRKKQKNKTEKHELDKTELLTIIEKQIMNITMNEIEPPSLGPGFGKGKSSLDHPRTKMEYSLAAAFAEQVGVGLVEKIRLEYAKGKLERINFTKENIQEMMKKTLDEMNFAVFSSMK